MRRVVLVLLALALAPSSATASWCHCAYDGVIAVPVALVRRRAPDPAIAELLLQYGTLNHVATGDASTGAVSLSVGYRLVF